MTDTWRELPPTNSYPGYTELRRGTRTVASIGHGPHVREAIVKRMNDGPSA